MTGMNRNTGAPISGLDQIVQDIGDVLTTPKGSRVMRRAYGSDLPDLVDRPQNRETAMLLVAASAGAISRWIRNVRVLRCQPAFSADGRGALTLDVLPTGTVNAQTLSLTIPF
ncbi:baseplate assembly protein W [Asticcacaulis biprosthecium C19]|uniref:Baseplate assembly protein W n=1 Tax=Asticcacaulis biprosthecium C19 TaxID=715226 RepID=F4QJB8_9CAUL|nr:GPW/gp25 family protein [Asticcacaulis biprosthecium]EGF93101.1 baseplate assembly protein W [Asticcacaulis biprosthecium C19]